MSWDAFFKNILKEELGNKDLKVDSDIKVGKLPLIIDLVIKKKRERRKYPKLPIITKYLKKYNIFEFKSAYDKPKDTDISKLTGYCGLYSEKMKINIIGMKKITCWYVVSRRPRFIQDLKLKKLENGLYYFDFYYPIYFLIINDIDINEENILLLLFSSGTKLRRSLELLIENKNLQNFISMAFILYPNEVSKIFAEKELTMEDFTKNIKFAMEMLGLRKVIEAVGINKVIEEIGINKVIEEIGIDKVIEEIGIDRVILTIGVDKVKKVLDEIKKNEGKNT